MPKPSKRPRDVNQLAAEIVSEAAGETERKSPPDTSKRPGGKAGGKARAEGLSPKRRREIAKKAAERRWKQDR